MTADCFFGSSLNPHPKNPCCQLSNVNCQLFSMTILPTVAAIITTFNRQDKLCRFLDLILAQTYPNLQIVVVDSSSSDGTVDLVKTRFPQVSLIQVSDREFWTGATNAGVKLALDRQVDFILTINDDAVIAPDYITKLVNLAEQHQLSILGTRIDYLTPKDRVWSLGTYTDWGSDRFLKIAYNDLYLSDIPPEILAQELISVDALPGNGVLIKTTVFEQIGLYNAKLCPHYHGDSELIMRAKKAGIQAWIAPQVILSNDFSNAQKQLPRKNIAGLKYIFFHPKSHLFMPPIIYLIWQYCPRSQQIATLWSLLQRFQQLKVDNKATLNQPP
jgi:GT2 family glycosyltransferase